MQRSESIANLAAALAKAQADFLVPKKAHTATVQTRTGGTYTYDYSTLDELLAAVRPALKTHALAVVQNVTMIDGRIAVATLVFHESGESLEFDPVVLAAGDTAQSVGAAITYARRYSLGVALNVAAEEDDDAQTVTPPAAERRLQRPAPVIDHETGEEVPAQEAPMPPPGFYYVSGYAFNSPWHEALLVGWASDGSSLKVSTKLEGVGKLLAKADARGLPIKGGDAELTMKANRKGEAYLNKVTFYDAAQPEER